MPRFRIAIPLTALLVGLLAGPAPYAQQAEPTSAASLCAKALVNFRAEPVKFEESATSIRSSGKAVLDRVVELASTCRESVIEITGHTDSSGDEAWNRILSVQRAQTVADYIAARGIATGRLVVIGAGSSKPIADNARRFGRSLNRRIEIAIRPLSAADISRQPYPPDSSG